MRKFHVTPPELPNLPPHVLKYYCPPEYFKSLIKWSWKEYEARLNYLTKLARPALIQLFLREASPLSILAESEQFRYVLQEKLINQSNWNSMSGRERVFIRRTYELFRILS